MVEARVAASVELLGRERAFLDATLARAERARRRRRALIAGTIGLLSLTAGGAVAALLTIRGAHANASLQKERADREAARAREAQSERLRTLTDELDDHCKDLRLLDGIDARLAKVLAAPSTSPDHATVEQLRSVRTSLDYVLKQHPECLARAREGPTQ
jgi:hypothetical protein